jgi:hypothetical protein
MLKKYDTLIVTGCSHTFGAESLVPGDCDNPENPGHSWAQQLGEQLAIPMIVNLSECGNSNDKMFQDIIYEVVHGDYSARRVLCIVQYTHWDRTFIRNPLNADQGFNLTAQVAQQTSSYPAYVQAAVPGWVDHLATNVNRYTHWLYQTVALRGFLRSHNIDFACWHVEQLPETLLAEECFALYDQLPRILHNSFDWYKTMDQLGPRQPKGHYDKATMALWLAYITKSLDGHYDFNTIPT